MNKKLSLSKRNKTIAGVCGGFAEFLGVDPTLIRVLFVFIAFIIQFLPMIIVYIICWAIMPADVDDDNSDT